MNLLLRTFVAGGLFAAVHTFAADAFEGKVSLAITTDKGHTQALDYSMKGKSLRMDMNAEGHSMSTIMDMAKREMLILMPEQRMYMVRPIPQPQEHPAGPATQPHETDIERTGKTEKILGYTCEQVLVKDKEKGNITELWIAENLGMFMGLGGGPGGPGGGGMFGGRKGGGGGGAGGSKWEEVLKGKGGFPLRVISRDAGGKEAFKMEATKIEPGHVSDSDFMPPPGFQKFQMPDMGGMNPFNRGG